ncbi:uncharacterized protein LOC131224763 [Magnolia sinica]|uniref:uncharacterized protein LOC131224763 n=1 Tax=Magnolia sinica TaxID=86752 RepID=UPI002659BE08|nr:uncharacterized protein LOC131224763 [Magnolia sinica]
MASSSSSSSSSLSFLLVVSVIVISAIGGANARPGLHFHPCNTLFISFTTISSSSSPDDPNRPSAIFALYRQEFSRFDPATFRPSSDLLIDSVRPEFPRPLHFRSFPDVSIDEAKPEPQIPRPSFGVSSLRERTKDILSVVLALLFGVGCGALTSATMYLVWSVVTSRYEGQESDGEDGEDHVVSTKMGYIKIPAAPVKEGYEGK